MTTVWMVYVWQGTGIDEERQHVIFSTQELAQEYITRVEAYVDPFMNPMNKRDVCFLTWHAHLRIFILDDENLDDYGDFPDFNIKKQTQ